MKGKVALALKRYSLQMNDYIVAAISGVLQADSRWNILSCSVDGISLNIGQGLQTEIPFFTRHIDRPIFVFKAILIVSNPENG